MEEEQKLNLVLGISDERVDELRKNLQALVEDDSLKDCSDLLLKLINSSTLTPAEAILTAYVYGRQQGVMEVMSGDFQPQ